MMDDSTVRHAFPPPSPEDTEHALAAVTSRVMARSARRRAVLRAAVLVFSLGGAFGAGVLVGAGAGTGRDMTAPATVPRAGTTGLIVRAPVLEPARQGEQP